MEFTEAQVAALVLGYLRGEKLYTVVEEFIKCCPHFDGKGVKNGKRIVTRVTEKCLIDFLDEYADIYTIVQGRLEEINFHDTYTKKPFPEEVQYLLDRAIMEVPTSTPVLNATSEVEATSVNSLPGNNTSEERSVQRTPKRKSIRCRSKDREETFDVSEIFTQTLLENHELHEKIAENINMARNTGEDVIDEHISAGASIELDAVIKTVLQRTEEDPVYNKLIDEIVGTSPFDNPTKKNSIPARVEDCLKSKQDKNPDPIEDHNNDAIRSIIEAAQVPEPSQPRNEGGEVYLFDGSLDTYLKSSGATAAMNQNPVYINPSLIVMPPPETTSTKQFYIVKNQPLINMNVKRTVLTENEIMSIPTIIVNDGSNINRSFSMTTSDVPTTSNRKKPKVIKPKATQIVPKLVEKTKILINSIPETVVVTASQTVPSVSVTTTPNKMTQSQLMPAITTTTENTPTVTVSASRSASHVRNLDFSTPTSKAEPGQSTQKFKVWDQDLRRMVNTCKDKTPPAKRKRALLAKKKKTKIEEEKNVEPPIKIEEEKKVEPPIKIEEEKQVLEAPVNDPEKMKQTKRDEEEPILDTPLKDVAKKKKKKTDEEGPVLETPLKDVSKKKKMKTDEEGPVLETPLKDVAKKTKKKSDEEGPVLETPFKDAVPKMVPKTPGAILQPNNMDCTSFEDVLEEHLKGVDLTSMPTPSIPITPGFALTPGDIVPRNQRSTDYSTSSSYYQPSDGEQNHSIEQLIEECRRLEDPQPRDNFADLKILSDVVVKQGEVPLDHPRKYCSDHLNKFNNNVIGKKNLSLLKRQPIISSSSDSDSDSGVREQSNKTVICKSDIAKTQTANIKKIINAVEVKSTLDEEMKKKDLLSHLELKRQRTIQKIKNDPITKKAQPRNSRKPSQKVKKRKTKKEEKTEEEAQKMVTDLAQRGIHLVPTKNNVKEEVVEDAPVKFDRKTYEDCEIVAHDGKTKKKKTYDLSILKRTMKAEMFCEELNEDVTRMIRWTESVFLLDLGTEAPDYLDDELMDFVFSGSVQDESKQGTKGGKKRKSKFAEVGNVQVEKKSKTYENNIKLLKKIDVDVFLDKVHGE